jgi:hypothetical protein
VITHDSILTANEFYFVYRFYSNWREYFEYSIGLNLEYLTECQVESRNVNLIQQNLGTTRIHIPLQISLITD